MQNVDDTLFGGSEASRSQGTSARDRLRKHGRRASRRGRLARERRESRREAAVLGLPAWEGLVPVLSFLTVPAAMALAMVVTGGGWPPALMYGLAGLIGLWVAFSAFRSVELIFACLVIYLPFSTTYVIPIAPGINGTNMLMVLGLFAAVMRAGKYRDGLFGWPPGTLLVAFFAVLSAASGITALMQPGGYTYLLYGELLNYKAWLDQFLLYIIALSFIRDIETAKRMMVYMGVGTVLLVLYSVPEMIDKMGRSTIEKSRIEGPHQQSNNFGGFVAYTLLPLVAFFLAYIKDVRAWLLTPYFLIAAKVLISTFSRGAYLAIAAGSLLAGYYKGRGFVMFWVTLVVCFLLVFPRFIPESIMVRLQSITQAESESRMAPEKLDKSSEHRLVLWRAAVEMIMEDPLTGKGFKYFQKLKGQYTEVDVTEADPHNMYLYIGSQMGLPALTLFLMILMWSFYLGSRLSLHREDRFIRAIGIGGTSSTVCYAVICMFGSRAVNLEFTAYFWTYLVAMQVIHCQLQKRALAATPARSRTNAFDWRDVSAEPPLAAGNAADDAGSPDTASPNPLHRRPRSVARRKAEQERELHAGSEPLSSKPVNSVRGRGPRLRGARPPQAQERQADGRSGPHDGN